MKRYAFKKLDAFTTGASSGNPAGCILLDTPDAISKEDMQRIAYELGNFVSEVGYVWPTPGNEWSYELRYFSREREVNFCGHATVAIMHDLLRGSPNPRHADTVSIKTRAGVLAVEDRIREENLVFIHAPEPQFLEVSTTSTEVAQALGLCEEALDRTCPIAFINAGLNTLLIPLRTLADCIGCRPDYGTLRGFCLDKRIEIITIFTFETSSQNTGVRTRVFAPAFGYLEDPATGSGNAALGYHLASTGRWHEPVLRVEQGPSRERPNIVTLKKTGSRIQIGGQSVCRLEGYYMLV
ncbi:MAG: PhzF family phenazine biosynthesis protein [Desulfatitalea sp.]